MSAKGAEADASKAAGMLQKIPFVGDAMNYVTNNKKVALVLAAVVAIILIVVVLHKQGVCIPYLSSGNSETSGKAARKVKGKKAASKDPVDNLIDEIEERQEENLESEESDSSEDDD